MNLTSSHSTCSFSIVVDSAANKQTKNDMLQRNDKILIHAAQCRDANCRQYNCTKMKNVLEHTKFCTKRKTEYCSLCKSAFSLYCHHGLNCSSPSCSVSFCWKLKKKFRFNQLSQEVSEDEKAVESILNLDSDDKFNPAYDANGKEDSHSIVPSTTFVTMVQEKRTERPDEQTTMKDNKNNSSCKVKSQWSVKYQNESSHATLYHGGDRAFLRPMDDQGVQSGDNFQPIEYTEMQSRDIDKFQFNNIVGVPYSANNLVTTQPALAAAADLAEKQNVGDFFGFNSTMSNGNNNDLNNAPDYNHFAESAFYRQNSLFLNQNFLLNPLQFPPFSCDPIPPAAATSSRPTVIVNNNNILPDSKENVTTSVGIPTFDITDETEDDVDFIYNFAKEFLMPCSSSSSPATADKNFFPSSSVDTPDNNVQTKDDDDDEGVEIIAEVKNVEVVAELPKTEIHFAKHGAKRRRILKETKAVVDAAEEDLTCCICLKPFDVPVLCFDCKKITGCKKCIDDWGAHCPSCRGTTGTTVVRGLDKIAAKLREYDDVLFVD